MPEKTFLVAGWEAIAETFRVSRCTVEAWQASGAPIILLPGKRGAKVPLANLPELWEWLMKEYG